MIAASLIAGVMLATVQVMSDTPNLPVVTIGGAVVPGLLDSSGTLPYNKVLTEITKVYNGGSNLVIGTEVSLMGQMTAGEVDCALISARGRDELKSKIGIIDLGRIDALDIHLYGREDAPRIRSRTDLAALRIIATEDMMSRIDDFPVTQTVTSTQNGLRQLLRSKADYFIGYRFDVDHMLQKSRAGGRFKMLNPSISQRYTHLICRDEPRTTNFQEKAAIKLDGFLRTDWISVLRKMD